MSKKEREEKEDRERGREGGCEEEREREEGRDGGRKGEHRETERGERILKKCIDEQKVSLSKKVEKRTQQMN